MPGHPWLDRNAPRVRRSPCAPDLAERERIPFPSMSGHAQRRSARRAPKLRAQRSEVIHDEERQQLPGVVDDADLDALHLAPHRRNAWAGNVCVDANDLPDTDRARP